MGLTISKMLSRLFSKKEMRILMVRRAPAPGRPRMAAGRLPRRAH